MKRYAVVAVVALVLVAMAAPVQARGVERARLDIENVAGQAVCGGELLTYVGTLEFRSGRTYEIAFFAPVGPPPELDRWVRFEDRWEIYDLGSIDLETSDGLTCPNGVGSLRMESDRGWGHFEKNKFIGYGPGGIWTGKFVDEDGNPAPFISPTGELNPRFVGLFWLFGGLD